MTDYPSLRHVAARYNRTRWDFNLMTFFFRSLNNFYSTFFFNFHAEKYRNRDDMNMEV